MSIFQNIDFKLLNLSEKLGAKLSKDRPDSPRILVDFEERRIDWIDNNINKAIIIQPSFEVNGVNSKIWYFINIAWFDDEKTLLRPTWLRYLIEKKKFEIIEKNIDNLIQMSVSNLINLKMEDLLKEGVYKSTNG